MATKKRQTKPATKVAGKPKAVVLKKTAKPAQAKASAKVSTKVSATASVKTSAKAKSPKPSTPVKTTKPLAKKTAKPAAKPATAVPSKKPLKETPVTAKKTTAAETTQAAKSGAPDASNAEETAAVKPAPGPKGKAPRTTLDDLALDINEKDELLEEEKRDLAKALRDDEDEPLETAFVPTDTSERFILVVDEDGQRRTETVSIVQQILPNAVIEVADDPDEALEVMEEADFDTYVVNFLMPGFSASPFVKAVANHPDHPLLIGFAADKISDALDQRKGLKIIPLKRLFDLDVSADSAAGKDKAGAED